MKTSLKMDGVHLGGCEDACPVEGYSGYLGHFGVDDEGEGAPAVWRLMKVMTRLRPKRAAP